MEVHRSSRYERGETMASALWGKFANEVLKEVKFKYDHTAIRQELVEHMEELYEDLQAEGLDAPVAEVMAVEYMGDAAEIGKALNGEHSPLLGWAWLICKRLVVVLSILFLLNCIPIGGTLLQGIFTDYQEKTDSPLVYILPLEWEEKQQGETIKLKELRYYEDGTLEIRGSSLKWRRHWAQPSGKIPMIYDERGQYYHSNAEQGASLGTGIYFRTQIFAEDFPLDAETVRLRFDIFGKREAEFSLSEGKKWSGLEGEEK